MVTLSTALLHKSNIANITEEDYLEWEKQLNIVKDKLGCVVTYGKLSNEEWKGSYNRESNVIVLADYLLEVNSTHERLTAYQHELTHAIQKVSGYKLATLTKVLDEEELTPDSFIEHMTRIGMLSIWGDPEDVTEYIAHLKHMLEDTDFYMTGDPRVEYPAYFYQAYWDHFKDIKELCFKKYCK